MDDVLKAMPQSIPKHTNVSIRRGRLTLKRWQRKRYLSACLKYAPLKSDFVRALSVDETIKSGLSDDMFSAETTYIEADYDVDPETGEVTEATHDNADRTS